LGYGGMQGIPMVASSPVRHESPLGMNPIEVQSYQPPWKALSDFALHTDLDRLDPTAPPFQQLVNQVSKFAFCIFWRLCECAIISNALFLKSIEGHS